jgi:rhodanese-related sulfurtransferase
MKKALVLLMVSFVVLCGVSVIMAQDNPLKKNEKRIHGEFSAAIPAERIIGVNEFRKVHDDVLVGKKNAYLIDVRSHDEFYAFHIEGTDHVPSGHMYTLPKNITDPNAEIYVFCRTNHRAAYAAGFLYKYGYKNVWLYNDGIVGWAAAGLPFVNQFTGKFKIFEYRTTPSDEEKSYRIRENHPY